MCQSNANYCTNKIAFEYMFPLKPYFGMQMDFIPALRLDDRAAKKQASEKTTILIPNYIYCVYHVHVA
jgi:hypothetical protein